MPMIKSWGAAVRQGARQGLRAVAARAIAKSLPAVAAVAQTALTRVNRIEQRKPEVKFFDTSPATLLPDVNPAAATTNLTLVPVGTGVNNRLGSEINMESIEIGYKINQTIGHTGPATCRVIVFQDKARNQATAAPTVGEVLETGGALSGNVVVAPIQQDFPKRYRILHDKIYNLGIWTTVMASSPLAVTFHKRMRIPKRYSKVLWDETGNAQGDLRGNVIYLLAISDAPGDPLDPQFNSYFRINFSDN